MKTILIVDDDKFLCNTLKENWLTLDLNQKIILNNYIQTINSEDMTSNRKRLFQ